MTHFEIVKKGKRGKYRAGILKTPHGVVETPVFMPVGTHATVKALRPDDLQALGAQIILGNTYHLYLRPGSKLIKQMGGLHTFMNWHGPILTDSGGFQAFSLGLMIKHGVRKMGPAKAKKTNKKSGTLVSKMTEEGVVFTSHLDGSKHILTPELSAEVQLDLGSDIVLALDELLSPLSDRRYARESLDRTHRWEERTKAYFDANLKNGTNPGAQMFGILQGVYDRDIRETEAKWVASQDFSGVSIGGSFGTSEHYRGDLDTEVVDVDWAAARAINETMEWVVPLLPEDWPKHGLGIGEVQNLFECIERGIDMFDCVSPTRRARHGNLYISPQNGGNTKNHFTTNIRRSDYIADSKPIDPGCVCYSCQNFSRSYIRHLFMGSEILSYQLATIHNVHFIVNLVKQIRQAILDDRFEEYKASWLV